MSWEASGSLRALLPFSHALSTHACKLPILSSKLKLPNATRNVALGPVHTSSEAESNWVRPAGLRTYVAVRRNRSWRCREPQSSPISSGVRMIGTFASNVSGSSEPPNARVNRILASCSRFIQSVHQVMNRVRGGLMQFSKQPSMASGVSSKIR